MTCKHENYSVVAESDVQVKMWCHDCGAFFQGSVWIYPRNAVKK